MLGITIPALMEIQFSEKLRQHEIVAEVLRVLWGSTRWPSIRDHHAVQCG